METESKKPEATGQASLRHRLQTPLRVSRELIGGLGLLAISGGWLLDLRAPNSYGHFALPFVLLVLVGLSLLREDNPRVSFVSGCLMPFVFVACFAGLTFVRTQPWSPIAIGVAFAGFLCTRQRLSWQSRAFVAGGTLAASFWSFRLPWPNEQRCIVCFAGAGLILTLQGVWTIVRFFQGHLPPESPETEIAFSESEDRMIFRIIRFIFGKISIIQISSPELEERIRVRYQSEIDELTDLKFIRVYSSGETVSAFRLFLVLPTIIIFQMWRKKEVISWSEGARLMMGYPVLISGDNETFVEVSALGVKFYTAFQDGLLLISKTYDDDGMPKVPTIVKYAGKASIGDTWIAHQERIGSLKTEDKRASCQTNFQTYAELSLREMTLS